MATAIVRSKWFGRVATTAFVVLLISCGQNATSSAPPSPLDQLRLRMAAGPLVHQPEDLTGYLPNRHYVFGDGISLQYSTDVVRGTIVAVHRGKAFADATEDDSIDGDGMEVDFDDPEALWGTFHLEVLVDEIVDSGADDLRVGESILVGLALDPATDESDIVEALSADSYIFFLNRESEVFSYDARVFATTEDGSLLVAVGEDGHLSLPARPDSERLLREAETLDELLAASERPAMDVEVTPGADSAPG